MKKRLAVEPIKISSWPRDDVRYPKDVETHGVAHVRDAGVPPPRDVELELGNYDVSLLDFPVGTPFSVHVTARYDGTDYAHTFRFRTTGDDDDVDHYTVGPGLVTERGRWGRTKHSGFEFGVLIMGAVLDGV